MQHAGRIHVQIELDLIKVRVVQLELETDCNTVRNSNSSRISNPRLGRIIVLKIESSESL